MPKGIKHFICIRACYQGERRWEEGEIVRAMKAPSKHWEEYNYPVLEGQAETMPDQGGFSGQFPQNPPPDTGDQNPHEPRSDEIDDGVQQPE